MATLPTAEVRIRTVTDRPSLKRAEKDITSALNRVERLASRGGLLSKSYTQPLGKITGAVGEFEKSLEASNARVIAFGASAGIIYNVSRAFEHMVRSAVNLEHKLAEINVILNASTSGLKKFGNELFEIAKNTGQTFDEVSDSALEFARQGLAVEDTLKRTRDAMILTRLSGLDYKSSVEAVTATINSFNQTIITSTQLVNKLANVDAAFAVSSADLAKAVSRVGSSAQDANVGLDELIAMVTTAQQVTARGGAVIGNSLKTIFTRIQRPAVIANLEAFNVAVTDAQGATLPAIQVLKNFADSYDTLTPKQRAVTAEMVGGVFQVNVLKAALGDLGKNFSIYDRALKTSVNSTDEAIQRNAALNKTLQTLVNETMQNMLKVGAKIGDITLSPAIRNVLEGINDALADFEDNASGDKIGAKMGKGILEGIGQIIKGPGMVILGALLGKLLFSFTKFSTDAVKTFAGMNEGAKKQAEMQQLVQNILLKNPDLIDHARSSEENLRRVTEKVLEVIRHRNFALAQSADLSAQIATNLNRADLKALNVAMSGGATAGAWRPVEAAGGMIPSKREKREEAAGAISGGYRPGAIKKRNVKGVGPVTYNEAETVKRFSGMQQEAIMPPQGSDAGKNYQKKFQNKHGFNPYAAEGFVPNFALSAVDSKAKKVLELRTKKKWAKATSDEKGYYRKLYLDDIAAQLDRKGSVRTVAEDEGFAGNQTIVQWRTQYPSKGAIKRSVVPDHISKRFRDSYDKVAANKMKNVDAGNDFEAALTKNFGFKGKQKASIPFDFVDGFSLAGRDPAYKKEIGMKSTTGDGDAHVGIGHGHPHFISKWFRYWAQKKGNEKQSAEQIAKTLYPTDPKTGKPTPSKLYSRSQAYDAAAHVGKKGSFTDVVAKGSDWEGTGTATAYGVAESWSALRSSIMNQRKGSWREAIAKEKKYIKLDYGIDDVNVPGFAGGHVPNFATKILDKDQLAQQMGLPLGSRQVRAVFDEIVKQASQRGQIAETIVGTAGIGKTTEAIKRAGGKNFVTEASELSPSDQLVIVRAAQSVVDTPDIANARKVTFLKGAKEVVKGMRKKRSDQIRAGTDETGFGRKPSSHFGSSSGALTEALLAEKYAHKLSVFERQSNMSLKEVGEFEKINELKGASATIGAFSPWTVGHQDMARQGGANVAFVSKGAKRSYDVGLSMSEKAKLIQLADPNIMAVGGTAGIQEQFEHGGKAYRMKRKDTKVILGADRVSGGEEDISKNFKSYKGVTPVHGRLGGVSGTKIRQAIVQGNLPLLKDNLPPEVFRVIKKNIGVLQKRSSYIQQRKDHAGKALEAINADKQNFQSKYGSRKKKGELQEITDARNLFRQKEQRYNKRLSGYGGKAWGRLGLNMNFASQGFVPNFAYKGLHEKDFGTTMVGRKGAMGANMSEKQVAKMTAGMKMIRGPEGETLILGTDMKGRSSRMIATGLSSRKIKKSGAHWRTMLNEVPHLFDGLAYDLVGGVAGANWDPEGTTGAMAGVKFENEMAASLGAAKPGAKKGSDIVLGEKTVAQLKTQKNLQLKLALHERSKRDPSKIVDIASSFSKYLVDILSHNIKTQGLSSVTTPDRFQQAMGVLNANPAVKKDWEGYFGPMGTKSTGFIPNFASMDIAAMQQHLGVDADSAEFKEWQANRRKRLYDEEQAELMKGRGVRTKGIGSAGMFAKGEYGSANDALEREINPERVAASQNQALRAMGVPEYISEYGTGRIQVPPPGAVSFNTQDQGQRDRLKEKHGIKDDSRPTFNAVWNEEDARRNVAKRKWAIKKGVSAKEYAAMMERGGKFNAEGGAESLKGGRNTRFEDSPEMMREERNVTKDEIKSEIHLAGSALANQYGGWGKVFPKNSTGQYYYNALEALFKTDHPDFNRILITSTKDFVEKKTLANKTIHGNVVNSDVHGTNLSHEIVTRGNPLLDELESVDFSPLGALSTGNRQRLDSGYKHVKEGYIPKRGEHTTLAEDQDIIKQYTTELEDMVIQSIGTKAFTVVKSQKKMAEFEKMQGPKHKAMLQALGTYAEGLVPNFSQDALKAAVGREMAAGYGSGQVKVGYDSRLKGSGGVGVYNTTEGSLSHAINMHLAGGNTIGGIQSQGASDGRVPNFAGEAMDMGMMMASMSMLAFTMKDLGGQFKTLTGSTEEYNDAVKAAAAEEVAAKEALVAAEQKRTDALEAETAAVAGEKGVVEEKEKFAAETGGIIGDMEARSGSYAQEAEVHRGKAAAVLDAAPDREAVEKQAKLDVKKDRVAGKWGMGKVSKGTLDAAVQKRMKEIEDAMQEEIDGHDRAAKAAENKAKEYEHHAKQEKKILQLANKQLEEAKKQLAAAKKGTAAEEAAAKVTKAEGEVKDAEKRVKDSKKKPKKAGMFGKDGRAMAFLEGGGGASVMAAAPMLTSMAGQFTDDKSDKAAIEGAGTGLSMAATGAQMGQILGPKGAAIGAVIGLGVGALQASKAIDKAKIAEKMDKVGATSEALGKQLNEVTSGGQAYMESLDKLDAMMKDNSGNVTAEDYAKVQSKMSESLGQIPVEFQDKFKAALGDTEKIKEVFSEITADLSKTKADLDAARTGYELQEKYAYGGGIFGMGKDTELFEQKSSGGLTKEAKKIEQSFKGMLSGGLDKKAIEKAISEGKNLDFANLKKSDLAKLSEFTGKGFQEFLRSVEKDSDLEHMGKVMQEQFDQMKEGAKNAALAVTAMKKKNYLDRVALKQQKALNQAIQNFNTVVGKTTESVRNTLFTIQDLTSNVKKFTIDMAKADFEGARKMADPFLSKSAKIQVDKADKVVDIKQKSLEDMRKIMVKASKESLNVFVKKFSDINAKVVSQTAGLATKSGKEQLGELARNRKAQEAMVPVIEKAFEVWTNAPDDINALKGITDEVATILKNNRIVDNKANGAAQLLLAEIKAIGVTSQNELALAVQQRNQSIALQERQAHWAQKAAELQERLSSFGGQGDFFSKSAEAGMSKGFSGLKSSLEVGIKGAVSNSITDIGRAQAVLLDELINKLNFSSLSENLEGLAPMLSQAIAGRTRDIERQMGYAQRLTRVQNPDLVLPDIDAEKIATEQVAAQLKLNQMPDDVAALRRNSEILNQLIAMQTSQLVNSNEEAFDSALKLNGIPNNLKEAALGTQVTSEAVDNARGDILKAGHGTSVQVDGVRQTNVLGFAQLMGASHEVQEIAKNLPSEFARSSGLAIGVAMKGVQDGIRNSLGGMGTTFARAMKEWKDPIKELDKNLKLQASLNQGQKLVGDVMSNRFTEEHARELEQLQAKKREHTSNLPSRRTTEVAMWMQSEETGSGADYLMKDRSAGGSRGRTGEGYEENLKWGVGVSQEAIKRAKEDSSEFTEVLDLTLAQYASFFGDQVHGNREIAARDLRKILKEKFDLNRGAIEDIVDKFDELAKSSVLGVDTGVMDYMTTKGVEEWQDFIKARLEEEDTAFSTNLQYSIDRLQGLRSSAEKADEALLLFRDNLAKDPWGNTEIELDTKFLGKGDKEFETQQQADDSLKGTGKSGTRVQSFKIVTEEERKNTRQKELNKRKLEGLGANYSQNARYKKWEETERVSRARQEWRRQKNLTGAEAAAMPTELAGDGEDTGGASGVSARAILSNTAALPIQDGIRGFLQDSINATLSDIQDAAFPASGDFSDAKKAREEFEAASKKLAEVKDKESEEYKAQARNVELLAERMTNLDAIANESADNMDALAEQLRELQVRAREFIKIAGGDITGLGKDPEEKAGITTDWVKEMQRQIDTAMTTGKFKDNRLHGIAAKVTQSEQFGGKINEGNMAAYKTALLEAFKEALKAGDLAELEKPGDSPRTPRTRGRDKQGAPSEVGTATKKFNLSGNQALFYEATQRLLHNTFDELEKKELANIKLLKTLEASYKAAGTETFEQYVKRADPKGERSYDENIHEYKIDEKQKQKDKKELAAKIRTVKSEQKAVSVLKRQAGVEAKRQAMLKQLNLKSIDINQVLSEAVADTDKLAKMIGIFGDLMAETANDKLIQALAEARKLPVMTGKSSAVIEKGVTQFQEAIFGMIGTTGLKQKIGDVRGRALERIKGLRTEKLQGGAGDFLQKWFEEQLSGDDADVSKLIDSFKGIDQGNIKEWAQNNQDLLMSALQKAGMSEEQMNQFRKMLKVLDEEQAIRMVLQSTLTESNLKYKHQLDLFDKGVGTYDALNSSFENMKKAAKSAGKLLDSSVIQDQLRRTAQNTAETFARLMNEAMSGAASGDKIKSGIDNFIKDFIENGEVANLENPEIRGQRLADAKAAQSKAVADQKKINQSKQNAIDRLNKGAEATNKPGKKARKLKRAKEMAEELEKDKAEQAAFNKQKSSKIAALQNAPSENIKAMQTESATRYNNQLHRAGELYRKGAADISVLQAQFAKLEELAKRGIFSDDIMGIASATGRDPLEIFMDQKVAMVQTNTAHMVKGLDFHNEALKRNAEAAADGAAAVDALMKNYVTFGMLEKDSDKRKALRQQMQNTQANVANKYNKELSMMVELYEDNMASGDELRQKLEEVNDAFIKAGKYGADQFINDFFSGFAYNQQDYYKDLSKMSKEFGQDFRTGVAGAFGEAIKGTKTLKQAFSDMFADLADKMLDNALQMAVNSAFGALMPSPQGGGFAKGGVVKGGSGTKDDVPAYLTSGEYVIKKSAVNAYGQRFFDALNQGQVTTAAEGGIAKAIAKTKQQEMAKNMAMQKAGVHSFSYREADPDQKKKDWLGRETGQSVINTKRDYRVDLSKPITSKRIEALRALAEKYPDVGKNFDKDLLDESSIQIGSGASKVHLKNRHVYDNLKRPEMAKMITDSRLSAHALTDENNPQNQYKFDKMSAFFDYQKERIDFLADQEEQMEQYHTQKKNRRRGFLFGAAAMMASGAISGGKSAFYSPAAGKTFASGGLNSDDVPALLMGGEYVVRKDIVDKYGAQFFEGLNSGKISRFAAGGLVTKPHSLTPTRSSRGQTDTQVMRGAGETTNNISISVNVDSSGRVTSEAQDQNATGEDFLTEEESKQLASRIKSAVLGEIVEQKRPGGMLYGEGK